MKAKIRIALDIFLTVVLLTLFSKNFISMAYHEIVGLAVLIPILIHIAINRKAVFAMVRNFQRYPLRMKICLIVDILLVAIGLTAAAFIMGACGMTNSQMLRRIETPFVSAETVQHEGQEDFHGDHEEETDAGLHRGEGKGREPRDGSGRGAGQDNGYERDGMNMLQRVMTFIGLFGIMFGCTMMTCWIGIFGKKSVKVHSLDR